MRVGLYDKNKICVISHFLTVVTRYSISSDKVPMFDTYKHWGSLPENTRYSPNVGSMLAQRRRRWTNIETTLDQCLVFTGLLPSYITVIVGPGGPFDPVVARNCVLGSNPGRDNFYRTLLVIPETCKDSLHPPGYTNMLTNSISQSTRKVEPIGL